VLKTQDFEGLGKIGVESEDRRKKASREKKGRGAHLSQIPEWGEAILGTGKERENLRVVGGGGQANSWEVEKLRGDRKEQ